MPTAISDILKFLLGLAALVGVIPLWWSLRRALRGTTLLLPWRWGGVILTFWLAVWCVTRGKPPLRGVGDQLWYFAGILALCPPLAVLGSRRPMSRVWTLFILVPLLLVFAWPMISDWSHAGWQQRFEESWTLEEPMFVGFCVVLLMSVGNYLGTPLTLSGLLWCAATFLVVAPLCPPVGRHLSPALDLRLLAVLSLCASVAWGRLMYSLRTPARTSLDQLWINYREAFGMVWGNRLQERFNFNARSGKVGFRLFRHGFAIVNEQEVPQPGDLTASQREFAEYTLRWLLRRFVDPEWIDVRLVQCTQSSSPASANSDSQVTPAV